MSVHFRILPRHGLVYVRCEGVARQSETAAVFAEYAAHPDFRPGQKQLVDLSRVTGWDGDSIAMMKLQARKVDTFCVPGSQTLLVYYAPSRCSLALAKIALQSWDGLQGIVSLIQQSELGSLTLLGLAERSFAELLQEAR